MEAEARSHPTDIASDVAALQDVVAAVEAEITADQNPPRALQALRDALRAVREPGLAERFWTRRLDPPAGAPGPVPGPGLNAQQEAAWAASCSPGMNVVWGPPGTGKTRVIGHVLAHLLGSGRSVLLVGGTDLAVDRALLETARVARAAAGLAEPRPGQVVRVGEPSLPEVAEHPWLPLRRACEQRGAGELARLAEIERELAARRSDPAAVELERAQAKLEGFNLSAYKAARRRLANAELLATRRRSLEERAASLQAAQAEVEAAASAAEEAEAEVSAVAPARAAHREIDRLHAVVAELERDRAKADAQVEVSRAAVDEGRAAVDELARLPLVERLRQRGERAHLTNVWHEREAALAVARERAAGLAADLDRARAEAGTRAQELEKAASSHTREQVEERLQRHEQALARLATAEEAEREREREWRAIKEEAQQAQRATQPEPEDRRLVQQAERERLPELAADLSALRGKARPALEALGRLEVERERLEGEIERRAEQVIGDAGLVATTLAQLPMDKAARERRYDFVLVDEAAFALPPLVVLAATRASVGVTLFGDFLQNGPVSAHRDDDDPAPVVRDWLLRDSFAILGIDSPRRALEDPGCTVLTDQHRFGRVINDLVNRVAYGGVLEPAGDRGRGEDEIVVVDVAGASVYRDARSGKRGWWPVGPLVARVLAEHHQRAGQEVAIITPYLAERRLVEATLADAALDGNVEVGTAHEFQGRELPVVVFDTVEGSTPGSSTPGWVASGRSEGNRYELDGLRLFSLALTRARDRVHVVVDGTAAMAARQGPLRELQEMVDAGQVPVIAVAELLAPGAEAEPGPAGRALDVEGALHEAFAGIYRAPSGSEELYRRLESWIGRADRNVWIWSPFGAGLDELAPSLRAAVSRGVRVQVFVKPTHEHRRNTEEWLTRIRSHGVGVVAVQKMHQSIVVVDERATFIASHDALTGQDGAGEVMVLVEGPEFARQVLDRELAADLAECPRCERHPEHWCYARYSYKRDQRGWYWHCSRDACGWRRQLHAT